MKVKYGKPPSEQPSDYILNDELVEWISYRVKQYGKSSITYNFRKLMYKKWEKNFHFTETNKERKNDEKEKR